jgi:hypothetical protein
MKWVLIVMLACCEYPTMRVIPFDTEQQCLDARADFARLPRVERVYCNLWKKES